MDRINSFEPKGGEQTNPSASTQSLDTQKKSVSFSPIIDGIVQNSRADMTASSGNSERSKSAHVDEDKALIQQRFGYRRFLTKSASKTRSQLPKSSSHGRLGSNETWHANTELLEHKLSFSSPTFVDYSGRMDTQRAPGDNVPSQGSKTPFLTTELEGNLVYHYTSEGILPVQKLNVAHIASSPNSLPQLEIQALHASEKDATRPLRHNISFKESALESASIPPMENDVSKSYDSLIALKKTRKRKERYRSLPDVRVPGSLVNETEEIGGQPVQNLSGGNEAGRVETRTSHAISEIERVKISAVKLVAFSVEEDAREDSILLRAPSMEQHRKSISNPQLHVIKKPSHTVPNKALVKSRSVTFCNPEDISKANGNKFQKPLIQQDGANTASRNQKSHIANSKALSTTKLSQFSTNEEDTKMPSNADIKLPSSRQSGSAEILERENSSPLDQSTEFVSSLPSYDGYTNPSFEVTSDKEVSCREEIYEKYMEDGLSTALPKNRKILRVLVTPSPSIVNMNDQFELTKKRKRVALASVVWASHFILDNDKSFPTSEQQIMLTQGNVSELTEIRADANTPISFPSVKHHFEDEQSENSVEVTDDVKSVGPESIKSFEELAVVDKTRCSSAASNYSVRALPVRVSLKLPNVDLDDELPNLKHSCSRPLKAKSTNSSLRRQSQMLPEGRGKINVVQLDQFCELEHRFLVGTLSRPTSSINQKVGQRGTTGVEEPDYDPFDYMKPHSDFKLRPSSTRNAMPIQTIGIASQNIGDIPARSAAPFRILHATTTGWCMESESMEVLEYNSDYESPNHHPVGGRGCSSPESLKALNTGDDFHPDAHAIKLHLADLEARWKVTHKFEVTLPGAHKKDMEPSKKSKRKRLKKKKKSKKKKHLDKPGSGKKLLKSALEPEPEKIQSEESESDTDISTDGSLDGSFDVQIPREKLLSLKHVEPYIRESTEEIIVHIPPPWVFLGVRVAIYIYRLLQVLQRFLRSTIQKLKFRRLRDAIRYVQRLFRASRVRQHYVRLIQLKRSGRNLKLALKQFEKVDSVAEIAGTGEYDTRNSVGTSSLSSNTLKSSTSLGFLDSIPMLDMSAGVKNNDPVRRRVQTNGCKALKLVAKMPPDLSIFRKWSIFWKRLASLEQRFDYLFNFISSVSNLKLRQSLKNDFATVIDVYDMHDDEENGLCTSAECLVFGGSNLHPNLHFIEYSFMAWVHREFRFITSKDYVGLNVKSTTLWKLEKLRARKRSRLLRIRTAVLELRERASAENVNYLFEKRQS
ncbi:hypothetical protein HDU97_003607 [Phlyctochytrium planicorne]|nr:hypothetical protein HDU97_003607 [Phlyctochytrium planicorne]